MTDIFDSIINEISLSGISSKQRSITKLFPTFHDRVKAVGEKGGIKLDKMTNTVWRFKVHSGTDANKWYDVNFLIKDILGLLAKYVPDRKLWTKDKKHADLKKVARAIFFDADVECECSCLTGDTKIPLLDGRTLTMEQIYQEYGNDKPFWVYASDENGDFVPAKAYSLGVTKRTKELIEVVLDNGESIKCTPDHLFRMRDGSYKEAKDLQPQDSLMPLCKHKAKSNTKCGVLEIKRILMEEPIPVYDLMVENYHNFALDAGVYVHNCPAAQYWGPNYQLTQADAKYGAKENRPPDIRNPKQHGMVCKHIQALLNVLPFYISTVAKWLKKNHKTQIQRLEKLSAPKQPKPTAKKPAAKKPEPVKPVKKATPAKPVKPEKTASEPTTTPEEHGVSPKAPTAATKEKEKIGKTPAPKETPEKKPEKKKDNRLTAKANQLRTEEPKEEENLPETPEEETPEQEEINKKKLSPKANYLNDEEEEESETPDEELE